jgi:hypothetical protein
MFVFTRRRIIKPSKFAQALDFSLESAAHVGKLIGKNIAVSRLTYGQPAGVVQFTYLFDHMGELDQSQEKITSDAATAEYGVRAAELFEGAAEDNIGRLVVSTIQEIRPVMNVISAVASAGRAADVAAFGMEMHQAVTSATGAPAAFVVSVSGAFGGTRFAIGADSMADLQAANEKLQEAGTVAKLMEKARDLFVPGSAQSVILRRVN